VGSDVRVSVEEAVHVLAVVAEQDIVWVGVAMRDGLRLRLPDWVTVAVWAMLWEPVMVAVWLPERMLVGDGDVVVVGTTVKVDV